ncbi:YihY/virulence factor BrkB family protein [Halpernia frigidisoli]|uniref:Membrane protein n=1 Tax=Halpernia frigidisoli TaxID=1125876 RepID=A0A1I3G1N9_9FLAO|nr:YihY/virulence factor BrkB family protein [Halpernia frigidisoli]SFI17061.1 membrane protein [Halpernia frigidisoli]
MNKLKLTWKLFKTTYNDWSGSPAMKESAGIAYFALFSIPGLLIIITWVAGIFFGDEAVNGQIQSSISGFMGPDIAKSIQEMVASAVLDNTNILMKIIGIGSLVFGATTLFFQMQRTLNQLWDVESAPKKAFQQYLLDRANSLGMIVMIAFLLLVSLILSSIIGVANNWFTKFFGLETFVLMKVIYWLISFGIIWLLFAIMFKVLPDLQIQWKSVWMGAFVTAILFNLGKLLLTYYFEVSNPASLFGAAGSVILLMVWINYSCQLIFFGAEFTKVYAQEMGHKIKPSKHAKWIASKVLRQQELDKAEKSLTQEVLN